MPPNYDAKYLQHLRQFSFGKPSRDTGGSNPIPSAKQSATSTVLVEKSKIPLRDNAELERADGRYSAVELALRKGIGLE